MTSGIPGTGSGDPEARLNTCLMCGCKIWPHQDEVTIGNKGGTSTYHHLAQADCQTMLRSLEKVVWGSQTSSSGLVSF